MNKEHREALGKLCVTASNSTLVTKEFVNGFAEALEAVDQMQEEVAAEVKANLGLCDQNDRTSGALMKLQEEHEVLKKAMRLVCRAGKLDNDQNDAMSIMLKKLMEQLKPVVDTAGEIEEFLLVNRYVLPKEKP